MQAKRPLVVAKVAASLDGRIALPSGESQWITGPEAREQGHRLRAECGAVLVGRGTVEVDDPLLTARIDGVHNQPLRVVLDPRGRLTGREKVFGSEAPTLHLTEKALTVHDGKFDPADVLQAIWEKGQTGVLIEGGPTTLGHFLRAGLIDRLELFLAPRILGEGKSWIDGLGIESLSGTPWLQITGQRSLGRDLWISAVPTAPLTA
jgi:diaminohydroxyphosphoribosylaminopyrimidine deaminase/5-amino-6-(5-phosphoribosylamino)uracil reductase